MENLMLRMQHDMLHWGILIITIVAILIYEAQKLRKNTQKPKKSKAQKKKALHDTVKKSRTDVIVCICIVLIALATSGSSARQYSLDRQDEPLPSWERLPLPGITAPLAGAEPDTASSLTMARPIKALRSIFIRISSTIMASKRASNIA